MKSKVQTRLLGAVYSCLRPLARIMLRSGISYKQFAEAAKRAFVHEAFAEKDGRGRPTNASRVAVRTGLSRKEIRRLAGSIDWNPEQEETGAIDHSGPPAKVLHAWHLDPRFCSHDGSPLDLAFDAGTPSFCDLVRAVAGDVPPGAVRAELRRAGAILDVAGDKLRVAKRYFVPADFDEKAITVISGILFPMTAGIDHNSNPARVTDGFIQRFAYSDRLSPTKIQAFRRWVRGEATDFVESVDDWLATNEFKPTDNSDSRSRNIAGVGVFYYEGPSAGGAPAAMGDEAATEGDN